MTSATCPVQKHCCTHCSLSFETAELLHGHLERSGHGAAKAQPAPVPPKRCACGTVLIAQVSLDYGACGACRWALRVGFSGRLLRHLAMSFRAKGLELQRKGKVSAGQDYLSEARALEEEALKREEASHG